MMMSIKRASRPVMMATIRGMSSQRNQGTSQVGYSRIIRLADISGNAGQNMVTIFEGSGSSDMFFNIDLAARDDGRFRKFDLIFVSTLAYNQSLTHDSVFVSRHWCYPSNPQPFDNRETNGYGRFPHKGIHR